MNGRTNCQKSLIQGHKKQYQTSDFERHIKMTFGGLRKYEHHFIHKYFLPDSKTLELGCGSGRIGFGMEKELSFSNITAIDFVESFIKEAKGISLKIDFRTQVKRGIEW